MSFPLELEWVHLNVVRAKYSGSKSLVLTNKLSAAMLRPYEYICKTEMHLFECFVERASSPLIMQKN
jgi:hypothetical protein